MGDVLFIRGTAFEGYEKSDVDKRLEQLNTTIYELKTQLRENKLVIQKLENGETLEKSIESALGSERANITNLQVKNDDLKEKYKSARDRAEKAEKENDELKAKIKLLEEEAENSKTTIEALKAADNAAGLSYIFSEAQKSAENLKAAAKKESDEITENVRRFAEELIADTNDRIAQMIFEAQKRAADIDAETANKTDELSATTNNMRAALLGDVDKFADELKKLREALDAFEKSGIAQLEESEKMLTAAKDELTEGGIPVFRAPVTVEPDYPDEPEKAKRPEPPKDEKKKLALDQLQAMAESIGKEESAKAEPEEAPAPDPAEPAAEEKPEVQPEPEPEEAPSDDTPDLELDENANPDLLKLMEQAMAIGGDDEPVAPKKREPEKPAETPENKPDETPEEPPKKKAINLADLAKQAAALADD